MEKTKYTGVYFRDLQNKERVFIITYKINGKLKKEKVGSNTEGVTAAYASKIRAKRTSVDRLKDDAPMMLNQPIPTLDECFKMYMEKIEGKSDSDNIQRRYNLHVKKIFGHLKLDEINTQMLESFRNKARTQISVRTKRNYAPKTINDWLNIIGTVFNYMINVHGLKLQNPAHNAKLEREKVDNDRERYLELNEIELLWDHLNNRYGKQYKDNVTENMKVFLALSLSTGARLRSVLTISKADVNLLTDTITIKNHKSKRTYNGYIHPKYKPIIAERMKKISQIDYLVSQSPNELHRAAMHKCFKPLLDELFNKGLAEDDAKRRVVIHTFRHTFASQLAIHGIPIYTIMKLMDHADISQTIRYAKLSPNSGKDSVFSLKL